MKRLLAAAFAATMAITLAACGSTAAPAASSAAPAAEAAAEAAAPAAEPTGKIAVIRNMSASDHTTQFFQGCIDEGKALGYTVDTFMSDQDDTKMQDLMNQCLNKDYDIWVVSHANEGYQNELVSKAVEKGIKVACFDCGGEHVPGVSYTSQNDRSLSEISLDAMIETAKAAGIQEPVPFVEINILGLIVPFDTRHAVIEEYEAAGKIKTIQLISPNLASDTYSQINTAVSSLLKQYPEGQIGGLWAASSGFLDGAIDAIEEANRTEIAVSAVDISNTEIQRLVEHPEYCCCAAVDPYVIGVVDVRLAVLNSLGVETPETVVLEAVKVSGEDLTAEDDMSTLANHFEDFGSTDLYDTDEIKELRAKFAN